MKMNQKHCLGLLTLAILNSQGATITIINDKNTDSEIVVSNLTADGKAETANIIIPPSQSNTLKNVQNNTNITEFTLDIYPYPQYKAAGLRWIIKAPTTSVDKITFSKAANQAIPTFNLPTGYDFKSVEANRPPNEPSHVMRDGAPVQLTTPPVVPTPPVATTPPAKPVVPVKIVAPTPKPTFPVTFSTTATHQQMAPVDAPKTNIASPVGATQPQPAAPVVGNPVQPSGPTPAPGQPTKQ